MGDTPGVVVFALAWQKSTQPIGPQFAQLARWLSQETGLHVAPRCALSYSELARMIGGEEAHLAWLPPIVYVHLQSTGSVEPIVLHERGGQSSYRAAFVVRADSSIRKLRQLRGTRAAWVDPWSASGYVLPRLHLKAEGLNIHTLFAEEAFYGSHDAALRALLSGRADVTATFARVDDEGLARTGGWTAIPEAEGKLRVLATVGSIPGDVIVARHDTSPETREKFVRALVKAPSDPAVGPLVRDVFGVEQFRPDPDENYAALRGAVKFAVREGIFGPR